MISRPALHEVQEPGHNRTAPERAPARLQRSLLQDRSPAHGVGVAHVQRPNRCCGPRTFRCVARTGAQFGSRPDLCMTVILDPAPPSTLDIKPILEILKQGIASLAPGRTMQWALGAAQNSSDWDAHKAYRVRIEAEGPFGAIEPLEYVISVDDLNGSRAASPGNLHAVAAELHEMTRASKELNEIIRSASLEPA